MKAIQIDDQVLYDLFGGCEDSLNEVYSVFISSYQETRQNLSSAFYSGNLHSLKRLLHFHGPSFMYLGLPQVAGMFKELEHKCAQAGNHFTIAEDFSVLMQTMETCLEEILRVTQRFRKAV